MSRFFGTQVAPVAMVQASANAKAPDSVGNQGLWRRGQAQLDPTALSVLAMLLPAAWTFWPWALACS